MGRGRHGFFDCIPQLPEDVDTRQAPWLETKDSRGWLHIVKVRRSIYGLWQSPQAWNGAIDGDLRTINFLRTASDTFVYGKGSGNNSDFSLNYVMLTLYMDDLMVTRPNLNTVAKVRKTLMVEFIMTDLRGATQILGIDIIQDKECGTISISQGLYVLSLMNKCDMAECNPVYTPGISHELTAGPVGSVPLNKENTIDGVPENRGVPNFLVRVYVCWHLIYGITGGAVHEQANINPHGGRQAHLALPLRHIRSPHHLQPQQHFKFIDFCDASFGTGNPEKARSTSENIYFLSAGVVHFRTTSIQKIAAHSTTEANLIVMSSCAMQEI